MEPCLSLPGMPVFCNVLWGTREEAVSCARGDIELVYCPDCTLIANAAFDPDRVDYTPRYDNTLTHSAHFREYQRDLAERLVEGLALRDRTVIEVGSGKGDFLLLLAEVGNVRGVGFDPSYEPRREVEESGGRVRIVRDYYSDRYADHGGDAVVCRQVLEHISPPSRLLDGLRRAIGDRTGVPVFFEVPNALYTLENVFVWDVIYEHPSYFTPGALRVLFTRCGFTVDRVEEEFGGQYLGVTARSASGRSEVAVPEPEREQVAQRVRAFARTVEELVARWSDELATLAAAGERVAVWGAGSKGVTFLNLVDRDGHVSCAVDLNPGKQGRFVPGSGQEIVGPSALPDRRPDHILVMNPLYEKEIRAKLHDLGVEATVRSL